MAALAGAATALAAAAALAAADAAPVRVAVLVPFAEDALREVPQHALVVATVRRALSQPVPEGIVDLGNPHDPNLEQLVVARPDLVVGDATIHAAHRDTLVRGGAEVLLLDTSSVDATFASLARLGERVGAGPDLAKRIGEARGEIEELALPDSVPVLALFGTPAHFLVVTDRTWLGDLLGTLRFENLGGSGNGSERFPGYVDVSHEELVAMRPQLVLLVAHGDPRRIEAAFREQLAAGGAWTGLRDAAVLGAHAVSPALFSTNPGLHMPEAARSLRSLVPSPAAP